MLPFIRSIFIIIGLNSSIAFASDVAFLKIDDGEISQKDTSLVNLAYSHSLYANVASIFHKRNSNTRLKSHGSAVYIGGKTCLTAAHCYDSYWESDVRFEINNEEKYYKVKHFILHPQYKENIKFDLAVLILEDSVEGLNGLKINYGFSKSETYSDYQHLLTYVGYGLKVFGNNWFNVSDNKRRAIRSYTYECSMDPKKLGIYATPYGQHNKSKTSRPLELYEAQARGGMSGGGAINSEYELVSVIFGTKFPTHRFSITSYFYPFFALFINIFLGVIDAFCFSTPHLNATLMAKGTCTASVPLGPFKEWIEETRREYDNTYYLDIA